MQQTASFAIWSLALQFPALAIGLLIARLHSPVPLFLGLITLIAAGMCLMSYWNVAHKIGPFELATLNQLNTIPTATAAAVGFIILGLPLYAWARRSWLNAELG